MHQTFLISPLLHLFAYGVVRDIVDAWLVELDNVVTCTPCDLQEYYEHRSPA